MAESNAQPAEPSSESPRRLHWHSLLVGVSAALSFVPPVFCPRRAPQVHLLIKQIVEAFGQLRMILSVYGWMTKKKPMINQVEVKEAQMEETIEKKDLATSAI